MKAKYTIFLFSISCFIFSYSVAQAATLYFVPPSETIYAGDVFPVEIRLDSDDAPVNAVEANIDFPSGIAEIKSIERTNSILNLWPKEPSFSNSLGIASLLGGLPDPGFHNRNGLVGILYFQAKNEGAGNLSFKNSSRVLLNDGLGSEASLVSSGITLNVIKPPAGYEPKVNVVVPDTTPPDAFTPVISKSKYAFDGKYFVAFQTQDHEFGISHYEVQEKVGTKLGEWKIAVSPYVLETQEGEVTIFVKAVDKAGNETIGTAEITIPKKKLKFIGAWLFIFILLAILSAVFVKRHKMLR